MIGHPFVTYFRSNFNHKITDKSSHFNDTFLSMIVFRDTPGKLTVATSCICHALTLAVRITASVITVVNDASSFDIYLHADVPR